MKAELAGVATREELIEEKNRLEASLAEIRHHLAWLERQIFGSQLGCTAKTPAAAAATNT